MREACLYNNWNFVPIFLKIYRPLIRWTHWSFFWGEVAVMSPHDGGTHLEWGVEDRGMGALSQVLSDESLYYSLKHILYGETHITFHGGALISYIYIFCFHDDVIKWELAFVREIHRWLREFTGHHTDQWRGALMFSLNKRLSKQSRRRWFDTPSRSLGRHCDVVPNSDPVIRAAVRSFGSFGVQRVTLVQFWIGETGQIGSCIMEGMASNLAHCSTLITIPWN